MRNLTLIYTIALSIIAIVIGLSQYLVQYAISSSIYDSRTINISGRQSMLSQKITKTALAMETASNIIEFTHHKEVLSEEKKLWEKSHNALQYGNEEMALDNVNNSDQTFAYFLELEPHYTAMKTAVEHIIEVDYNAENPSEQLIEYIDVLLVNEAEFLRLMNQITLDYDNESRERITQLSHTEYILLVVAFVLLVLEGLFIFRPMIKRVIVYTKKLVRHEESLKRSLRKQEEEKLKVEYLNKQAESVFQNVKQGIFLLDKNLVISELYSKSLEEIFEKNDLARSSFLELMRPRLLERNQLALEMFVKHLFNPEIEEEVLIQLNPVSEIEIYYQKGSANIESRYIKVSFSRIKSKDSILNVLVTITDQTEEVLLIKKITESEEKNKRDSLQLLSMLKIDPYILKDFLNLAAASLKGISSKYENEKDANLKELIRYTFHTIHNLKGNANNIDLELLSSKLHDVENVIMELKDKKNLQGGDFLTILFEINELNQTVSNMQRMLDRISEFSSDIQTKKTEVLKGNQKLFEGLNQGLQGISKELNKKAQLKFKDHGIEIPPYYELLVKDVFIQLIRNSLVHGIESKEERLLVGKHECAIIFVKVNQEEDQLRISYQDDGRGLDKKKILNQALSNKLIREDQVSDLDSEMLIKLIFRDGFSTADTVNQHGGRGQGLGLVYELLKKNNGQFKVASKKGKAFKMEFVLPLKHELEQA